MTGRSSASPGESSVALAEKDARDRFLNIAATCPDAIMCAGADGRIIFWNVAAEEMFGHSARSALRARQDLILTEDARQGYEDWLLLVQNSPPDTKFADHIELVCRRSDGSTFPAEMTYSSWYESSGFVICSMI